MNQKLGFFARCFALLMLMISQAYAENPSKPGSDQPALPRTIENQVDTNSKLELPAQEAKPLGERQLEALAGATATAKVKFGVRSFENNCGRWIWKVAKGTGGFLFGRKSQYAQKGAALVRWEEGLEGMRAQYVDFLDEWLVTGFKDSSASEIDKALYKYYLELFDKYSGEVLPIEENLRDQVWGKEHRRVSVAELRNKLLKKEIIQVEEHQDSEGRVSSPVFTKTKSVVKRTARWIGVALYIAMITNIVDGIIEPNASEGKNWAFKIREWVLPQAIRSSPDSNRADPAVARELANQNVNTKTTWSEVEATAGWRIADFDEKVMNAIRFIYEMKDKKRPDLVTAGLKSLLSTEEKFVDMNEKNGSVAREIIAKALDAGPNNDGSLRKEYEEIRERQRHARGE